jgi:glycosyltransferase involved in cell wall biosynthesis
MPAYNAERYAAAAVESILAQTFRDFEFLIVDDGSTDGTRAILERYAAADPRIRLVSRPNTGYVVALNEMLARARGEFIARMDSDDISMPTRLERQLAYLDANPDCVMVGSRVRIIDPDGRPLTVMGDALTHEEIDAALMAARGQMVYHPSVVFRRGPLLAVGPYRLEYEPSEDMDIFLRLAEVGRVVNLAEPLLEYREHLGKVGHLRGAKQAEATYRILEAAHRRRGLPLPAAVVEATRARLPGASEKRRVWAWWALGAGNLATARKHAAACLVRDPFSIQSWRLLYCTLRGH